MSFKCCTGFAGSCSYNCGREGFNMRVYTPFGTHWYAYFMRRLAERPANLVFALRSIVGK